LTTILHVDDEAGVRETVKLVLESSGFSVISAKDADEAAQTFRRRASSVSAVIADIRLRRATDDDSGAVFAKRLKEANPTLPVIIYSAYTDETRDLVGDLILHKGGKNPQLELVPNIDRIRQLCEGYDADRFTYIRAELIRLKEKYRISEADFRTLVSVLPVYDVAQTALLMVHDAEAEQSTTNPHIVIVRPDDPAAKDLGIARPIALVVTYHEHDGLFLAELYASPMIYAYGEERDEAINALLNSLKEDFDELTEHPERFSPSADLARFRRYLTAIFAVS
jgi:CheY-like chemotaxis protein